MYQVSPVRLRRLGRDMLVILAVLARWVERLQTSCPECVVGSSIFLDVVEDTFSE